MPTPPTPGESQPPPADALPCMAWAMRPDFTLEYLNTRAAEYTGVSLAEVNAIGWAELVHPEDREATLARVSGPLAREEAHEAEFRFRHHSGEYRWVNSRAMPQRDENGRLVRWVGTTEDIHEWRLAVAELRQSERRHRILTEATPQVVWSFGKAAPQAQSWWREVTGQSPEASRGWGWLDALHPDDAPRVRALWEQALETGATYETEYRIRRRDGSFLDALVRGVPLKDAAGQVSEWIGTITDVSERKEAERALRTLNHCLEAEVEARTRSVHEHQARFRGAFDHAPIGMALVAPDGRWLEVNQSLRELLGYTEEELLGTDFQTITHPDDLTADIGYVQAVLAGEIRTYQMEKRYYHKSGRLVYVLLSVSLVRGEAGEPLYFISQIKNITERKRVEAELQAAKLAAEAASQAKGEFLANMSHEIRTPMNGVLGMAELALETELTAEQREYLRLIRSSGESLLRIINDILDFSKIEASRLDLETIPFNLDDVLLPGLRLLAFRAAEKGIGFRMDLAPELPQLVGDPGRLEQVVINLASNAVKFTERGEVHVTVNVRQRSSHEATLRFSVRDTGIGISPEKQELVFEAFSQADGSTTRKYGGTGLGLSISQQLTRLMGGELRLNSEPGGGTTFWFELSLPLAPAAHVTSRPAEAPGPAPARETVPAQVPAPPGVPPTPGESLRILLVEDDATNQALAKRILERAGHEVELAGNGRIALQCLAQSDFDVVLMDVQMPEMDGLTATAAIRERENGSGHRVPIIGLTAHAMQSDRDRCLDAGMDDYVSKPLRRELLFAALAAVPRRPVTSPD